MKWRDGRFTDRVLRSFFSSFYEPVGCDRVVNIYSVEELCGAGKGKELGILC